MLAPGTQELRRDLRRRDARAHQGGRQLRARARRAVRHTSPASARAASTRSSAARRATAARRRCCSTEDALGGGATGLLRLRSISPPYPRPRPPRLIERHRGAPRATCAPCASGGGSRRARGPRERLERVAGGASSVRDGRALYYVERDRRTTALRGSRRHLSGRPPRRPTCSLRGSRPGLVLNLGETRLARLGRHRARRPRDLRGLAPRPPRPGGAPAPRRQARDAGALRRGAARRRADHPHQRRRGGGLQARHRAPCRTRPAATGAISCPTARVRSSSTIPPSPATSRGSSAEDANRGDRHPRPRQRRGAR